MPDSQNKAVDLDFVPKMSFEDLLELVGTRGPWNILLFLMCGIATFVSALHAVTYQFLGATPDHWCSVEPLLEANWTQHQVLSLAIPFSNTTGEYESCYMYDFNYTAAAEMGYDAAIANRSSLAGGSNSTIKCYSRDFNLTQYQSTVVTEWDLVCERRVLYSSTQSVVMVGKLLGYLLFGYIIDVWGRRFPALLAALVSAVLGFLTLASPSISVYILLKCFISITTSGLYLSLYVLLMENCATRYRGMSGSLILIPWGLGCMVASGIAYLVRTWMSLQLVYALLTLLFILYFLWLPESPRWLIVRGRYQEALKVLKQVAKMNRKTPLSEEKVLSTMRLGQNLVVEEKDASEASLQSRVQQALRRFFILLIIPEYRVRTLVLIVCWFGSSMVYYGLTFNAHNINTSPYLYIVTGGVLEVPSSMIMWLVLAFVGRRKFLVLLQSVCGVILFLIMLLMLLDVGGEWALATFSQLGKVFSTCAFGLAWLYTAELYPTQYRSLAVGMGSVFARVGAFWSPYVNDILGMEKVWAPTALFGSLSLVSAALTMLLPETRNLDLAEQTDSRATHDNEKETAQGLLSTANS